MADKPIHFSAPMIRALLDGRKTQTRRVLVPQPLDTPSGAGLPRLHYAPFQKLWVREAWRTMDGLDQLSGGQIAAACEDAGYKTPWTPIQYEADGERVNWIADPHTFGKVAGRYRHARFMPRWASRLTLIVTDVRVQRLQDISEADAAAEGVTPICEPNERRWEHYVPHGVAFRDLWNSLHGPDAWDAHLWVAALTFTVHRRNIDDMEAAQ